MLVFPHLPYQFSSIQPYQTQSPPNPTPILIFEHFICADLAPRRPSSTSEAKRKEATAVVLLGVIGAEFGQDIESAATKRKVSAGGEQAQRKRGSVVEGFGIAGSGNNLARCTSTYLHCLLKRKL